MIVVQKFGGTSVKDEKSREKVLEKIINCKKEGNKIVVVVSAMGRSPMPYATDTLINLVKEKCKNVSKKDMDLLMSCGENISAVLISSLLNSKGYSAEAVTGVSAKIITDSNFSNAKVKSINVKKIIDMLDNNVIPVITGFQGVTEDGEVTTLGRGGSDTTASLIGEAIKANVVEIYTDVNGIMTADPKICPNAKTIDYLPYDELFQMADSGAKVIHKKAAFVAKKSNIELRIKNTFTDEKGTKISNYYDELDETKKEKFKNNLFTGIASLDDRVKVTITIDEFNNTELFEELANANVSLDMINIFPNQNVFTIKIEDLEKVKIILNNKNVDYDLEEECSKITVIGEMTGIPGVMNKILKCLKTKEIKVYQTVDSLVSISILVKTVDVKDAVRLLHDNLFS